MLARLGSRLVRPAAQVVRQGASSPRARFTTRAASQRQNGSNVPQRSAERNLQAAQPGYGIARRPVAADLFFPGQVGSIFRDIEQELTRLWGNEGQAIAKTVLGQVDIHEKKDAYIFKMDAPGLRKEDIKVRVTPDNLLVISGERVKEELEEEGTGVHRVERVFGKFMRRFQLPDNVDPSRITANLENGVLSVVVPKKEADEAEPQHTDIPVMDAAAGSGGSGSPSANAGGSVL